MTIILLVRLNMKYKRNSHVTNVKDHLYLEYAKYLSLSSLNDKKMLISLQWIFHLQYQYPKLCPFFSDLREFTLDIWVFDLISEHMHMNSAYFSRTVLICALSLTLITCCGNRKPFCGHWFLPGATPLNQEQHISANIMNLKKASYYRHLWHFDIIKSSLG